jgi:hypothetical protein
MPAKSTGTSEVLVEFIVQGAVVKTTAIDSKTGTEASIVGPTNAPRAALQAAAIRKLDYVLKRKSS